MQRLHQLAKHGKLSSRSSSALYRGNGHPMGPSLAGTCCTTMLTPHTLCRRRSKRCAVALPFNFAGSKHRGDPSDLSLVIRAIAQKIWSELIC